MTGLPDEIRQLITSHISTLHNEAREVSNGFRATPPDVGVLAGATHKIKGSSGTIGFIRVSEVATKMNNILRNLDPGTQHIPASCQKLLVEFEAAVSRMRPEDSTLWAQFMPQDASFGGEDEGR